LILELKLTGIYSSCGQLMHEVNFKKRTGMGWIHQGAIYHSVTFFGAVVQSTMFGTHIWSYSYYMRINLDKAELRARNERILIAVRSNAN